MYWIRNEYLRHTRIQLILVYFYLHLCVKYIKIIYLYIILKMGWGYYAPCIVYGFNEKNQEKILSYDFLGNYDLERYGLFTNKTETK